MLDEALKLIPGVVENGLFLDIADAAIIAGPQLDGIDRGRPRCEVRVVGDLTAAEAADCQDVVKKSAEGSNDHREIGIMQGKDALLVRTLERSGGKNRYAEAFGGKMHRRLALGLAAPDREAMLTAARQRFEGGYTIDRMVARHEELYRRLAA